MARNWPVPANPRSLDLLICDEPSNGLDARSREVHARYTLFQVVRQGGRSIIMSESLDG